MSFGEPFTPLLVFGNKKGGAYAVFKVFNNFPNRHHSKSAPGMEHDNVLKNAHFSQKTFQNEELSPIELCKFNINTNFEFSFS